MFDHAAAKKPFADVPPALRSLAERGPAAASAPPGGGHRFGDVAVLAERSAAAAAAPLQFQLRRRRRSPPEEEDDQPNRRLGLGGYAQERVESLVEDARANPAPHVETAATFGLSEGASLIAHSNPLAAAVSAPSVMRSAYRDVRRMGAELGNAEFRNASISGFSAASRVGGLVANAFGVPVVGPGLSAARLAANTQKQKQKVEPDEAPPSFSSHVSATVAPVVDSVTDARDWVAEKLRKKEKKKQGKLD